MFWIEVLIVLGIVISSMCGLFLKLGEGQVRKSEVIKYVRIAALVTVIVLAVINLSMKLIVFMVIFTIVNKIVFVLILKGFKEVLKNREEITKGIYHVMVIVALLITIFTVVFSMNITNMFFKDKKDEKEEEVKTEQVEKDEVEKEAIDEDEKDNEDVGVSKEEEKENETEEVKEVEPEGNGVKEEIQDDQEVENKNKDYDWLKEKEEDKSDVEDVEQENNNEDVTDTKEQEQQGSLNVCVDLNTASKWELLEVLDLGEPLVELIRSKRPYETFEEVGHINGINQGIVDYLNEQNAVQIGCK